MSRMIDSPPERMEFDLGEEVTFLHQGERLRGKVVRVYNTRDVYHVEVAGQRYLACPEEDDMRRTLLDRQL